MRNKAARNLRKLISTDPTLSQMDKVVYEETNVHTKLCADGMVNFDGSPSLAPVQVSTRVLSGCQRKLYQQAKRIHHVYQH